MQATPWLAGMSYMALYPQLLCYKRPACLHRFVACLGESLLVVSLLIR